jgi:nucleoside-triphosphatase
LVEELRARGVPVGGFTTREFREQGRRAGFVVEAIGGESAVLADVARSGAPRVGRYGVDVPAFERVALPAVERAVAGGGVVVIDELGQMELFSEPFVRAVRRLFEQDVPVVATVHAKAHPATDAFKQRPYIELLTVTQETQEALLERLATRLLGALGEESSARSNGEPHQGP